MGCIMMRKCHLNTCPVGIATQDPVLRKKFAGHARERHQFLLLHRRAGAPYMAKMGFRRLDEMVGRVDMLEMRPAMDHWKARGLDFSQLLFNPQAPSRVGRRCTIAQDHGLEKALDAKLIDYAKPAHRKRHAGGVHAADPQCGSHRGRDALRRDRAQARLQGAGARRRFISASTARRARASERFWRRASRWNWKATPTITSARASPAARSSCIRRAIRRSCRRRIS